MKNFEISYNILLNMGGKRLMVKHISARTNIEAITKFFENCPFTHHFELVECKEV